MLENIQVGYQVFVGGARIEEVGAVRRILPKGDVVVWVENAGDFTIPVDAIEVVHARSQKVILDPTKLDDRLREAIDHAHDAEQPNQ